jgi:hypothetical protein
MHLSILPQQAAWLRQPCWCYAGQYAPLNTSASQQNVMTYARQQYTQVHTCWVQHTHSESSKSATNPIPTGAKALPSMCGLCMQPAAILR